MSMIEIKKSENIMEICNNKNCICKCNNKKCEKCGKCRLQYTEIVNPGELVFHKYIYKLFQYKYQQIMENEKGIKIMTAITYREKEKEKFDGIKCINGERVIADMICIPVRIGNFDLTTIPEDKMEYVMFLSNVKYGEKLQSLIRKNYSLQTILFLCGIMELIENYDTVVKYGVKNNYFF